MDVFLLYFFFLSHFLCFCRTQLQKLRILKIHFNPTLLLLSVFCCCFFLYLQKCTGEKLHGRRPKRHGYKNGVVCTCLLSVLCDHRQAPLDGRTVASINGFGQWSCGDCLVGQWHGGLARALAEEPPVGGPVFALQGATETGGAERVV